MTKSTPTPAILLTAATGAVLVLLANNSFAVTETDSFQEPPAPAPASFTPTYAASAGDLLLGETPTASTGNFANENAGGLPVLTDGVFGPIGAPNGGQHPSFASAGDNSSGLSATYAVPAGTTLTSVVTLGGWNDGGRDTQAYTVSYELSTNVGTFVPLATVSYDPTGPGNPGVQNATQVTLDGFSIPNVDALKFDFATTAENGHQGYAELEAYGTAVPEPSTWVAAGGLLLLAAGDFRRRLKA